MAGLDREPKEVTPHPFKADWREIYEWCNNPSLAKKNTPVIVTRFNFESVGPQTIFLAVPKNVSLNNLKDALRVEKDINLSPDEKVLTVMDKKGNLCPMNPIVINEIQAQKLIDNLPIQFVLK